MLRKVLRSQVRPEMPTICKEDGTARGRQLQDMTLDEDSIHSFLTLPDPGSQDSKDSTLSLILRICH